MAGILAIVGARGAEELVRQAARPLLRRPWHFLELEAPEPEVALGAVGERVGIARDPDTDVVVALEGELFGDEGVRVGEDAARELLRAYLADGDALEPPEGIFGVAIWDPRTHAITLVTDRYGRRPIYLARHRGAILVSGELKGLVAAGLEPVIDTDAWAEILAYEGLLGEHTPLAGVRLLPGASTLTIDREGEEQLRRRWAYRVEPADDGDERELVDQFAELMRQAVARRLTESCGIAVSGGLDSRTVAAVLRELAPSTVALSFGMAGAEDLVLGARVSRAAGLPHRDVLFDPGFIARGAAETVWLSEGNIRSFHVHHLALRALRQHDDLRAAFINFGGDHTVRTVGGPFLTGGAGAEPLNFHRIRSTCVSDDLLEHVFTPAFAAVLRGRARDAVVAHLANEVGDPLTRIRQLGFENQRHKIWPGAELFADDLAPRDPYDDFELVEFCRRMPERFRRGGLLQRGLLKRFAPDLADIRNVKDGLPVSLGGRRRRVAAFGIRVRRGARRRIDRVLGPAWWPVRTGLGDYATDLRRHGGPLLGVLLEPRTLERNQLRQEAVTQLVTETLRGRARNTRALGVLLTLELFQRQFVDGDGFESVPESWDSPIGVERAIIR